MPPIRLHPAPFPPEKDAHRAMTVVSEAHPAPKAASGIEGLDDILRGGFPAERIYLIEGIPGSGKTTLALQFLLAGAARGERGMLVALTETREEMEQSAASHGWDLGGLEILEIGASNTELGADTRYTMFHPSEVELSDTTKKILAEAERVQPARMVFDSLSEFRLLAENPLRYRRQFLVLKQYFTGRRCTVLFIDDRDPERLDKDLHSIVHGVVTLERHSPEYGTMRRRLHVSKLRGVPYREGYHDFAIRKGGLRVFPRLVAAEHGVEHDRRDIASGLAPLDSLLGGGLTPGTSTLILGAAGTGKSSLGSFFASSSAARGERVTLFVFDESLATLLARASGLGFDLAGPIESGRINVRQIDPAELSPGEFAHTVRREAETGSRLIIIDSLNGYINAMPSERFLTLHLHELLTYLGQRGVTTLLLMTQHGIVGGDFQVPVDTSYLADTVILLRYFEFDGEIRQAISVVKKRTGKHEHSIRELSFGPGLRIGGSLRDFEGVLTGVPRRRGSSVAT
jgi:circadian clock protein KaiC